MPVPKAKEEEANLAFPLLIALAVFSQVANCNGKKRVDIIEQQNAGIQAAIVELRARTK